MNIIRYEQPWRLMNHLHQQLDQFFGDNFGAPEASGLPNTAWIPAVDIYEEKDRFVVRADLPGVDRKDVEVTAEEGVLTIRGERRAAQRTEAEGFERLERVTGNFIRRFTLPETAQQDAIKAKQVDGVLEITIPKQPKAEPRRISIDTH